MPTVTPKLLGSVDPRPTDSISSLQLFSRLCSCALCLPIWNRQAPHKPLEIWSFLVLLQGNPLCSEVAREPVSQALTNARSTRTPWGPRDPQNALSSLFLVSPSFSEDAHTPHPKVSPNKTKPPPASPRDFSETLSAVWYFTGKDHFKFEVPHQVQPSPFLKRTEVRSAPRTPRTHTQGSQGCTSASPGRPEARRQPRHSGVPGTARSLSSLSLLSPAGPGSTRGPECQ